MTPAYPGRGRSAGSLNKKTLLKLKEQKEHDRQLRERLADEQEIDQLIVEGITLNMSFMSAKEMSDLDLSKKLRSNGIITTAGAPFEVSARAELDALAATG
ncbi:hypothetical protein GcC1_035034, partial [Golovinomyces cichoracearum]